MLIRWKNPHTYSPEGNDGGGTPPADSAAPAVPNTPPTGNDGGAAAAADTGGQQTQTPGAGHNNPPEPVSLDAAIAASLTPPAPDPNAQVATPPDQSAQPGATPPAASPPAGADASGAGVVVTPPAAGGTPGGAGGPAGGADPDPTPEELAAITNPNVRKMVDRFKRQRDEARGHVQAILPDATIWNNTRQWLQDAGITQEQYTTLLGVGALMAKGDAINALAVLRPYYHTLQMAVGEILPAAMQARVDAGELTAQDAAALVRSNYENARLNHFAQVDNTRRTEQAAVDASQQRVNQIADTLQQWETSILSRDPDYPKKQQMVISRMQAMIAQSGFPASAQAAAQLADRALSEVNAWVAGIIPARQPNGGGSGHNHVPPGANSTNRRNTQREAASLADAVDLALGGTG